MRELPFLVVHGALVWRIAALVLAAIGFTIARVLRAPKLLAVVAGASFSMFWIVAAGCLAAARYIEDDLDSDGNESVVACPETADRELPLGAASPIAIAAATPLQRDRALDVFHTQLACQYVRTPETLAARLALDDLHTDAAQRRARDFYNEARFPDVLAQGPSDVRVAALLRLGRYDDAYRAIADGAVASPRDRTIAALVTRHWVSAAAAIDDEAAQVHDTRGHLRLQCLATAIRARTHQPASRALLQLAATGDDVCYVLAQSADPSLALQRQPDLIAIDQALVQLTAGERVDLTNDRYVSFYDVFADRDPPLELWLVPFTNHSVRQGALYELLTGFTSVAQSLINNDADSDACGSTCPRFATGIAMRNGWVPPNIDDPIPHFIAGGTWTPVFAEAARGNAQPLATQLRTSYRGIDLASLFVVLPHVGPELAEELELDRPTWSFRPDSPFTWVRVAAVRADIARISGNTMAGTLWTDVAHRHAAVLGDRDRLLLLLFDAIAH